MGLEGYSLVLLSVWSLFSNLQRHEEVGIIATPSHSHGNDCSHAFPYDEPYSSKYEPRLGVKM